MTRGARRAWAWIAVQRARLPFGGLADGALLAAVAGIHLLFARSFMWGPIAFDEQFFLYEGFSLGRGAIPYRDFQEFKPPVVFVLNMLGLKLFGLSGMHFRIFFLLVSLLAFLVVAAALRTRGVPRLVILAAVALMLNTFLDGRFLQGGTLDTSESAGLWFFLLGVGVLLARLNGPRMERWQQRLGGVLLALAPLSKEPFAIPTLLAWATLVMMAGLEVSDPRAARAKRCRMVKNTALAAVSVAVCWFAYMLLTRSFGAYLVNLRETLVYSADHDIMYGVFPKLGFWGTWAESWRRIRATYVNPPFLAVFMPFFLAALVLGRRPLWVAAGVVATFLGATYAVTIGHGFFGHYFIILMTGTFFATIVGCLALGERLPELAASWRRWLGPSLALMVLYTLQPRLCDDDPRWAQHAALPVSEKLVTLVRGRTRPDDRIWSVGMPLIYVAADRRSASRMPYMHDSLLHMYAGHTAAEKLAPFRAELEAKRPKLVILDEGRSGREQHMDALVMPFLRDHGYRLLAAPGQVDVPVYERPD